MSVAFQLDRIDRKFSEIRVLSGPYTLPHSGGFVGRSIKLICPAGISPIINTSQNDAFNDGAFTSYRFASSYSGQSSWLELTAATGASTSYWWITGSGWIQELVTSFPITLPLASEAESRTFRCKNPSAAATATINTAGGDLILDTGATSLVLAPLGYASLYSDGTQWLVVG